MAWFIRTKLKALPIIDVARVDMRTFISSLFDDNPNDVKRIEAELKRRTDTKLTDYCEVFTFLTAAAAHAVLLEKLARYMDPSCAWKRVGDYLMLIVEHKLPIMLIIRTAPSVWQFYDLGKMGGDVNEPAGVALNPADAA